MGVFCKVCVARARCVPSSGKFLTLSIAGDGKVSRIRDGLVSLRNAQLRLIAAILL